MLKFLSKDEPLLLLCKIESSWLLYDLSRGSRCVNTDLICYTEASSFGRFIFETRAKSSLSISSEAIPREKLELDLLFRDAPISTSAFYMLKWEPAINYSSGKSSFYISKVLLYLCMIFSCLCCRDSFRTIFYSASSNSFKSTWSSVVCGAFGSTYFYCSSPN